jgi:glycosyltransferase involved in cell wall biosynthesis
MKSITILVDYFFPAYLAGGPVKSTHALTNLLSSNNYEVRVYTRDHDLNCSVNFQLTASDYNLLGNVRPVYINSHFKLSLITKLFLAVISESNIMYLNSFFSIYFSIIPIFLFKLFAKDSVALVLAPRGELTHATLSIKKYKKLFYLKLFKFFRLDRGILFHATSDDECKEISRIFPNSKIFTIRNLNQELFGEFISKGVRKKVSKSLNLVYYSRITEKKNLLWFLQLINSLSININLDVIGPYDNETYYCSCLNELNANSLHNIRFLGPVNSLTYPLANNSYDFFVLPTLGENFGHAILESILHKLPVLISSNTPFINNPDSGVFSYDLDNILWAEILIKLYELDNYEYIQIINNMDNFIMNLKESQLNAEDSYLSILNSVNIKN